MEYEKVLVNTEEAFEQLYDDLNYSSIVAWDSETNGKMDRFGVQLVGMSFATDNKDYPNIGYYLPLAHNDGEQLFIDKVLPPIKAFLENESIEKVCHNTKFDEMVVGRYGINVKGKGHDTYIMNWLLSEDTPTKGSRGLKALVKKYFDYQMTTYEEVVESAPKKRGVDRDYNFGNVPLDSALAYACDDAYWCLKLFYMFKEMLEEEGLWIPYDKIERPFNRVLGNIEAKGILIDMDAIKYADKRFPKIIQEIEESVYEQAGEVFNIGSGAQLGKILFEKLGIGKNVKKTKRGDYKTDKKTLALYATQHKIVEDILRRKKIAKTHSTFVTGTEEYVAKDGRIHANFNGCGTVTGRLSCQKPNMQNLESDEVEEIKVRDFFIPSEGNIFVVSDFSQIELRIIAHFSKDKELVDAFNKGDEDFHDKMARKVFNVPDDETPTLKQRVAAKTLNFGVPYGRGPGAISEMLQISYTEAKQLIDEWFSRFKGVKAYRKYVIAKAEENLYVKTISGRKRRVPLIRSNDWKIKGNAQRQAFNTIAQGSAADLIKCAMIGMEKPLADLGAHMIIQVHDELVIDCPKENAEQAVAITKEIMEAPVFGKNPLRVPLVADPVIVDRWSKAK